MGIIFGYILFLLIFAVLSVSYCLIMRNYWKRYQLKSEKQKKRNVFFRALSVIILFKYYQKIAFDFFMPPIFLYNPILIIFPVWIFSVTLRGIKGYRKLRNIFIAFLLLYPLGIITFQKKKLNDFEQYCVTDFPKQIVLNPEYLPQEYFHEVSSEEKTYYLQNNEFLYYRDIEIGDLLPNIVDLRDLSSSDLLIQIPEMAKNDIYLLKCSALYYKSEENALLSLFSKDYYSICETREHKKSLPAPSAEEYPHIKTFFVPVTEDNIRKLQFNYDYFIAQYPENIIAVLFKDYSYPWQYLGDQYRSCRKYYLCPNAVFPSQCDKYPKPDYRGFFKALH